MPQQLTDEQWAYYQSQDYKARLADDLWNDPQLGKEAKALVKKKHPNIAIPDYDIESRVEERLNRDRKERDDIEAKKREDEEKSRWTKLRKETQDRYSFTDEGMEKLEKFMVEKNVGDYEVAASYMASKEPKTSEPSFDNFRWNYDKKDGFAEIAKDPEAWGRSEILRALHNDQERAKGGR
jgi:hypothetical protein